MYHPPCILLKCKAFSKAYSHAGTRAHAHTNYFYLLCVCVCVCVYVRRVLLLHYSNYKR